VIGMRTARVAGGRAREVLYRLWGIPDINVRQKWSVVWPELEALEEEGVRLLDAGCGMGLWSLEIAARRPEWHVVGLDKNAGAVAEAERLRQALGLSNVQFVVEDFLSFKAREKFDVVLSVASAHYLAARGRGEAVFAAFCSWLGPGGRVILLGPRAKGEVPFVGFLPRPASANRDVFTREQLLGLAEETGLRILKLRPAVFWPGTLAKQLSAVDGALRYGFYPLEILLSVVDRLWPPALAGKSSFWLLVAQKGRGD